jgi:hypothetical protein
MTFLVEFITAHKQFLDNGQIGDLFLSDLNTEFFQVVGNGLPLKEQGTTLSQELNNALGFHKIPILALVLLAGRRVKTLELYLLDLYFLLGVLELARLLLDLAPLTLDLLVDLRLALLYQPLD